MKNIEILNNMERAALLYALFPTEIPALIDFAKGIAESISQDETRQREQWNNGGNTNKFDPLSPISN